MNLTKFAKILCLTFTFLICLPGSNASASDHTSITIAKAEANKKLKTGNKKPSGKKTSPKPKLKPKSKSLKAKAAPAPKALKAAIATKKANPIVTRNSSTPIDWAFWFLTGIGTVVIGGAALTIWYEFRPTVNASGVVYGEFEYLPAHQGGAFTAEFHGDTSTQPLKIDPKTATPATVTREPLHADSRTVAATSNDRVPLKKAL